MGGRDGLILVDTGLGVQDIELGHRRLGWPFVIFSRPRLLPEETAFHRLQQLGHKPEQVRHIVVTHLDPDHTGGLADFSQATVHVYRDEFLAAMNPMTIGERQRYLRRRWANVTWEHHRLRGDEWLGFECVKVFEPEHDGIDLRFVPLIGHTRGQVGVAVGADDGWLLHYADSYFCQSEMAGAHPHCTPGLSFHSGTYK